MKKNITVLCLLLPFLLSAQKKEGRALADSLQSELPKAKADTNKVNILLSLAKLYDATGAKEAMKYNEQALALARQLNFKKGIAKSYNCMGSLYGVQGNMQEALHYDSLGLKSFEETGYKNGIANSYYNIGMAYQEQNTAEALKNLLAALKIFESGEDDNERKYGIINCNSSLGATYTVAGNFQKALQYHQIALNAAKEIGDRKRMSYCYSNMGIAYYYLGNYPEALNNHFSALKIKEETGAKTSMAGSYNNIAMVYEKLENHAEALKYDSAALKIYTETGNKHAMAVALQNMGAIYFYAHNEAESKKNYDLALKLYEETGDRAGIAYCYESSAGDYYGEGNYGEALKNYLSALKIFDETGSKELAGTVEVAIGNTFCKLGKYSDAEKHALAALNIAKENGSLELIKSANESLTTIYRNSGNYKKSLEAYRSFIAARDSMYNEENTKKTVQTQMQYDFDKREAAARAEQAKKDAVQQLRLQRKNIFIYGSSAAVVLLLVIGTLLMRQSKLRASQQKTELEQKQLRAQMNPHFIFNCLNSIQHFIVANDVKNANKYLSGFALLMRQTLEHSQERLVTLRKEIEYLENYLALERMRFEDKFTYEIVCADNVDKGHMEIPAMIIQPFIENAIRHGLSYLEGKPGKLKISFYVHNKSLYCEVDDNGIGREQSQKLRMTSNLAYESRGMELTRQRLALVSRSTGSEYKVDITDKKTEGQQPDGTTVIIKFPLES